jgi:hypothetical protein
MGTEVGAGFLGENRPLFYTGADFEEVYQSISWLETNVTLSPNMRESGPRPTLGELQRSTPWVWLWCER